MKFERKTLEQLLSKNTYIILNTKTYNCQMLCIKPKDSLEFEESLKKIPQNNIVKKLTPDELTKLHEIDENLLSRVDQSGGYLDEYSKTLLKKLFDIHFRDINEELKKRGLEAFELTERESNSPAKIACFICGGAKLIVVEGQTK